MFILYKKFQKYFKENNEKAVLKYDGERETKRFTIILLDKLNTDRTIFIETDNMKEEFENNILSRMPPELRDEFIEFLNEFFYIKNLIVEKNNESAVLILSAEFLEDIDFYCSVINISKSLSFHVKTLENINQILRENLK